MQKIPMATTLTSMSRSEKSAIVDDSDETLNSTQRFKQELIRANKSAVDSNLQTEYLEPPTTPSTTLTNPTVVAYPPHVSQPTAPPPNTTISAKSKQKGKEKEK